MAHLWRMWRRTDLVIAPEMKAHGRRASRGEFLFEGREKQPSLSLNSKYFSAMAGSEQSTEKESAKVITKASPDGKPEDSDVICLKPKMTLLNGVTVIVGSIIGSGIFVSPKGVSEGTGSVGLSLVVWVVSGIFSMVGAYCYAELGCMITKTGADYAYIMESFGPFVAFLRLWVECMIVRPCSQAIVALTFSFYVLRPLYPDCEPPDTAIRFLACLCICKYIFGFVLVNT